MRTAPAFILAAVLAVIAGAPADAGVKTPRVECQPQVRDAWIRMAPAMPMGAAYFTIENRCTREVALVGASSTRFGDVSMHETRMAAGISRMRARDAVVLRPGETVEFRPRGLHLMLMQPKAPVEIGSKVRVDLRLAKGRAIPVDFGVRGFPP